MGRMNRASVAALLHDLDRRSPAGCAIGLHIRFTPRFMFQSIRSAGWTNIPGRACSPEGSDGPLGMSNVGWILWSDLERIDDRGVLDRARDYGIMNGVTIALVIEGLAQHRRASPGRTGTMREAEIAELQRIFRGAASGDSRPSGVDRRGSPGVAGSLRCASRIERALAATA